MHVSFEEITLTKNDRRLLKKIKENPNLLIQCKRSERLIRYGLVEYNPIFEKTNDLSGAAQFNLSEVGTSYLEWDARHKKKNVTGAIKWVLVTIIAAAIVWVIDILLDLNFYETIKLTLGK